MPSQILVPLDGSEFGEHALDYAVDAAERSGATLHFVKVHETARETELDYLRRIANYGHLERLRVTTALLDGPVVTALETYTRNAHIDLVIMTTHGRGGLSRAWLGSVADGLLHKVEVPLVLLRPSRAGFGPRAGPRLFIENILIPLDGSALAESVLPAATALARLTGARFTLLQIVAPPLAIPPTMGAPGYPTDSRVHSMRAATSYLEGMALQLRATGHDVETNVVVHLTPAAAIVQEAATRQASVIAMATHGRSGWQRVALGSVADQVMRHTSAPLVVVRPDRRALHARRWKVG